MSLQRTLSRLGFPPGDIDGVFGDSTEAAVMAFQQSEGLVVDGVVGPRTARALGFADPPPFESVVPEVTVAIVGKMFPATPRANIERHLPTVLESLVARQLADRAMVLMALSTIRAETEAFKPVSEGQSRFNTPPDGPPFALYDNRKDLGNMGPPDGSRFKGRGFIQLTGRTNYDRHGRLVGLGDRLLTEPDLANDAEIAARLLASFLKLQETEIRHALIEDDLKTARRLVNGGAHGLDRFTDAFRKGEELLPASL